jgi:hypothetical protein
MNMKYQPSPMQYQIIKGKTQRKTNINKIKINQKPKVVLFRKIYFEFFSQ